MGELIFVIIAAVIGLVLNSSKKELKKSERPVAGEPVSPTPTGDPKPLSVQTIREIFESFTPSKADTKPAGGQESWEGVSQSESHVGLSGLRQGESYMPGGTLEGVPMELPRGRENREYTGSATSAKATFRHGDKVEKPIIGAGRLTAREMRNAVILSEVLSKPVSMRRNGRRAG